jgi:penicillin amidase
MEEWVSQLGEYAKTALRPLDGSIEGSGLKEEVEVLTDEWGVPHIYATNRDDLYFSQGYLHATERLFQVDLTQRFARGRLAELLGEFVLPLDKFFRTLGFERLARSWLDSIDEDVRRIGEPYFEGFRAGARSIPTPVEYHILGLEPEIVERFEDAVLNAYSVALIMSFTLSANRDSELIRGWLAQTLGPERARQLTPFIGAVVPSAVPSSSSFPGLVRELSKAAAEAGAVPGVGSNNWVVSGTRTTTGKPLLANDPHLKIQMPSIWMEMHLVSGGGDDMDVTGITLPGVPGVIIGHNRNIAWGFTNTGSDVEDLYLEKISEDGGSYEFKGEWHPIDVIREKIVVRNEPEARVHEVKSTRHGPLLTSFIQGNITPVVHEDYIKEAVSWRWYHQDVVASLKTVEQMNVATNWEEFREATKGWTSPGQNMVYADVDGNIGYQFTGLVPKRPPGVSGAAPQPGWTGENEWDGHIPFDDLPSVFNPETGFIATANNRMVDLDYPHYLTHDWEPEYRVRRITSLLAGREKHSVDDFKRIQYDTFSGIADGLLPVLISATASNGQVADAIKQIESWDRRMDTDSIGATIFMIWLSNIADALLHPRLGEELFRHYFQMRGWTTLWAYDTIKDILENPEAFWVGGDGADNESARNQLVSKALEQAVAELTERFGEDNVEWRWGRLHQILLQHPLSVAMPPLGDLLSLGPVESPGSDDTVNRGAFSPEEGYMHHTISSYRQIIDLGDFDNSLSVITTGNSGNPSSPHYRDQFEMWLKGDYHPMLFSRKAVESRTKGKLVLSPGSA